jgi:hypothetical protein
MFERIAPGYDPTVILYWVNLPLVFAAEQIRRWRMGTADHHGASGAAPLVAKSELTSKALTPYSIPYFDDCHSVNKKFVGSGDTRESDTDGKLLWTPPSQQNATVENIVASAAKEDVVSRAALERIIACLAIKKVCKTSGDATPICY